MEVDGTGQLLKGEVAYECVCGDLPWRAGVGEGLGRCVTVGEGGGGLLLLTPCCLCLLGLLALLPLLLPSRRALQSLVAVAAICACVSFPEC